MLRSAFVTGGSGFLGRHLLESLQRRRLAAVALARSDAAAAACAGRGARVVRGDLDDVEAMAAAMAGCDTVFHCAARVSDWDHPSVFERINVQGTAHALEAAKRAGVERFVHVSTEAVLIGGRPIVQADETWPLPERPMALYPASKVAAERLVLAASGLHTVIVRPPFIWGAGDTALLPLLVQAIRDEQFRWISGGHYPTSTCHVRNVVEGMLLAAARGRAGEVYFLTDGPPMEFREFIRGLLSTQAYDAGRRTIPRAVARVVASAGEALGRRRDYQWRPPLTRLSLALMGEEVTVQDAKARDELGYKGAVAAKEGLEEMRQARAATISA